MIERQAWVEIDLQAIKHNTQQIKKLLKSDTRLCAVVKADAYGHGAIAVTKTVLNAGADCLAVALLSEAQKLRSAGFTESILILGHTPSHQAHQVVAGNIEQTISTLDAAVALSREAVKVKSTAKVHIKVDTGMTRVGVQPKAAADFTEAVAKLPGIVIAGVFSHFSSSDSQDKTYANQQAVRFNQTLEEIANRGINIPLKHMANSAAILEIPETHFNMVRAGIVLYGLWPSDEVVKTIDLRPAMKFKALVSYVKEVPAGVSVSYGCTYVTTRPSRIATIPVGYADGWTRLLSGSASVLVKGKQAKVIGRICMDQFMIDVTDIPSVEEGDEVLLFGGADLPADEIARQLGTINYEVVCMISERVPRVYK
ncbi:alanine racemase [Dendrosporobacter sp. 1207_IL3150]|uniref:alanine racemase n=1 Tax=Dendrosporobacter sp. 1207_IL3150 TaxID=3084054 RepID=UPI002FD8A352